MRQNFVPFGGGGVCVYFLKSLRKAVSEMYGLWGGGGLDDHIFEEWSCKVDNAQARAMLEGPLLNPNRPLCCPLPQGQGPHFSPNQRQCMCPAVKPSWGVLYDPKIGLQRQRPLRRTESGGPCGCCEPAVRGFVAFLPGSSRRTCTHFTPPERCASCLRAWQSPTASPGFRPSQSSHYVPDPLPQSFVGSS